MHSIGKIRILTKLRQYRLLNGHTFDAEVSVRLLIFTAPLSVFSII